MSRFVAREAEFQTFGDEHSDVIAAILSGNMLERVQYRVSFATDSFSNADVRNWRVARVGWGLWFGPSGTAARSWSADRQDQNWIYWQASPWVPHVSYLQPDAGIAATPQVFYQAGILGAMLDIPVYRFASGGEYQLRHYDVDSELSSFPAYSYASETVMHLWAP